MKQKTLQHGQEHELYTDIKNLFHSGAQRLHVNRFGPKIYTDLQRIALLVLQKRSGKTYEKFCTQYLPESKWVQWLGLRELPSSSSIHRWAQRFNTQYIRALNDRLLTDEQPTTLAIDGTGIDSWRRSRHYEKRIGESPRSYAKADIIVDTDKLFIYDWSLLLKPRADAHVAKILLKRIRHWGVLIIGDKGYDAEELYELSHLHGNRFYAPVRNSPATGKQPVLLSWYKRKSHRVETNYHRRSLVESTIRSLKTRIGALTAHRPHMKKREFAWHVFVRNLELKMKHLLQLILKHHLG